MSDATMGRLLDEWQSTSRKEGPSSDEKDHFQTSNLKIKGSLGSRGPMVVHRAR